MRVIVLVASSMLCREVGRHRVLVPQPVEIVVQMSGCERHLQHFVDLLIHLLEDQTVILPDVLVRSVCGRIVQQDFGRGSELMPPCQ